jgi:hypothetical protein
VNDEPATSTEPCATPAASNNDVPADVPTATRHPPGNDRPNNDLTGEPNVFRHTTTPTALNFTNSDGERNTYTDPEGSTVNIENAPTGTVATSDRAPS